MIDPRPATREQLAGFHDDEYLDFLLNRAAQLAGPTNPRKKRKVSEEDTELLEEYGLVDDAPPFPGLAEHVLWTTGATLSAARALSSAQYNLAIAWDGGRHHAHRSKASGFCYANDLVLAINSLLPSRIFYLDLDVHFGDAVFSAYRHSRSVFCASIHTAIRGFFPASAAEDSALGPREGEPDGLRIGTRPGLSDSTLRALLQPVEKAFNRFRPDYLVIQAGADGLRSDPVAGLGGWSLSSSGLTGAVEEAARWAIHAEWACKVLVTGGGGYVNKDAARTWCEATRRLLGLLGSPVNPMHDVPEHEFLNEYAADGYSMDVEAGNKEDENLKEVDLPTEEGVKRMRFVEYLVRRAEEDIDLLGV